MSLINPRKQSDLLFCCALIFIATIFIFFVLVDLIYPFPESVISGDPWWRHNRKIVIVTVIDNVYSSNIVTVNNGDGSNTVNNISTSSDYFKDMSVRNKNNYAKLYKFEFAVKGVKDWDREESWANIPALMETMKEYPNTDWLWWIDSKLFISNPSIGLSSVLRNVMLSSDHEDKEMLIGYDCDGLNSASFLIRNSPWGRRFLSAVYSPKLFKDFKSEETAMQILIDLEAIEVGLKVLFVPLRTMNALALNRNCSNDDKFKWREDDFIVNFAGCEELQEVCDQRFNEVIKAQ